MCSDRADLLYMWTHSHTLLLTQTLTDQGRTGNTAGAPGPEVAVSQTDHPEDIFYRFEDLRSRSEGNKAQCDTPKKPQINDLNTTYICIFTLKTELLRISYTTSTRVTGSVAFGVNKTIRTKAVILQQAVTTNYIQETELMT